MPPKGEAWTDTQDLKFLLTMISTNAVAPNWKVLSAAFPNRTTESLRCRYKVLRKQANNGSDEKSVDGNKGAAGVEDVKKGKGFDKNNKKRKAFKDEDGDADAVGGDGDAEAYAGDHARKPPAKKRRVADDSTSVKDEEEGF